MISCLTDYIGLFEVTTPESGIFINRLPGIETTQLDLIRKEETYDIEDAWDDIQNRAIQEFEQRLNEWGSKYYKNRSYVANVVTGQYDDNEAIGNSDNYAGWLFDGYLSYYKNMKMVIPEVHLYTTNTAQSDITIFNAVTGDTLDTITHTFIANTINRVPIHKKYELWKYPKIFIAYDESEINTIKTDELPYNPKFDTSQGRISKSSTILADNISGVDGQGLIVTYNIECSLDNWVCQRLDLFTTPFLYLLGYEFCQERIYSDRINRYTLLKRERAKEMAENFLNRFNVQMDETLNALTLNCNDDYCFKCDREVNYRLMIP